MTTASQAKSALSAADLVQYLPGVGPKRAAALAHVGVQTVCDLLEYLPARHERCEPCVIENLTEGLVATIVGRIEAVRSRPAIRGARLSATLIDNTGRCSLQFFNAPWAAEQISRGCVLRVTGKVSEFGGLAQMTNPRFVVLDENAGPTHLAEPVRFESVYPATAELPSRTIARIIHENLDRLLPLVEERCSPRFLSDRKLPPRRWALEAMHRPRREHDVVQARRRLAYDELLMMQLAVSLSRHHRRAGVTALPLPCTDEIDRRIRRRLPFDLTAAQNRAVKTLSADLARPRPMNRLLQGDVGCGKTVVALHAALVAIANRAQVAVMAPTELLAEQHLRSFSRYLEGSRVRIGSLTGALAAKPRRELLAAIEQGEIDLVVGTHALIEQDVCFKQLGLVVVDEQHRFGVRQRATIRGKAYAPHYLVMTATPIPRTLAMTVFGDLDVTTIDALPPGRSPVATRTAGPAEHDAVWRFVRGRIRAGEQAFVVYPLVDESDKVQAKAATKEFEHLRTRAFADHPVGLIHGRMDSAQREAVMADFAAGKIAVLVATTVIEVGIDVPNATCMVIEHAERYGLSQLHQLRGRVGRGKLPGHCILMTDSALALHHERLHVLVGTTDGFKIAEEDLRLRGPGEMLGTRQHGLPELRVADLLTDGELVRMAQQDADAIIRADPRLEKTDHAPLRSILLTKYKEAISFLDVG